MAVAQKGVGVVWGVSGVTFTGFHATEPLYKLKSQSGERTSATKEILDANGQLVGRVFFDGRKKISINVTPSGASLAAAFANMEKLLPAPGTAITLVDGDTSGAVFEATYSVMNAKVNRASTEEATIDMDLEMSTENDVTTAIS